MTQMLWHGERYGISQKQTRIICAIVCSCGYVHCAITPAGQMREYASFRHVGVTTIEQSILRLRCIAYGWQSPPATNSRVMNAFHAERRADTGHQAQRLRRWMAMQESAAGVTPEIRPAWPKFKGQI